LATYKGTDDDPIPIEELAKMIIHPRDLGEIVIVANKKKKSVNVTTKNLTKTEIKGILWDALNKY
jgi:hypothetical protein